MDDKMKGLLDALHDQIQERDVLQPKLHIALEKIQHLHAELRSKIAHAAPGTGAWAATFEELLNEGDYVSASKLAIAALHYVDHGGALQKDCWKLRYEMARRLLDESRSR